ncbi:DUF1003 domain-containing protein [Anaeromyxobacter sp. Fw109-5]|uniref:DUF1003 domain-containing protein n=1 Tax=Anaeromyxobacter sp. (strain Fw109-5) TaxID=404589 RepID=UPI000158A6FC|nr:DUF1003 domain-containing protein [Anaeromyxobacter sp. Fw109-5]ABS27422.1 protein of unknown function DUF1003 [Anaeromyxobacter sp. Fw109-5]
MRVAAGERGGAGERPGLAGVVARNISVLLARRREEEQSERRRDRVAAAIGRFSGSMTFVWIHLAVVALWIAVNAGLVPGVPRFDRDFVKLATAASVEAIFLSTFVLIMQNRMAAVAEKRADLDLQISLLSEHEVTRLVRLVAAIAARMGIEDAQAEDLAELERDVRPEAVLNEMERVQEQGVPDDPPPAAAPPGGPAGGARRE